MIAAAWLIGGIRKLNNKRGPHVSKRFLGPLKAARFARIGPLNRTAGKLSRTHRYGLLGKRYAGEFAIIIGGTGSGKTLRLVLVYLARLLAERRVSLIVTDPKGNMFYRLRKLLGKKAGFPPVYLLSTLAKHSASEVAVINPFRERETRMECIDTLLPDPPSGDPIWAQNGRDMLIILGDTIEEALEGTGMEVDLPKVYECLKDPAKLDALAEDYPALRSVWAGQDNKTHESIRKNALAPLGGLENPRIRRLFDSSRAASAEESAGPPFESRAIVWLCIGPEDLKRMGPLAAVSTDYLTTRASRRPEGSPDVELAIEEAGICFPGHKLDDTVNYARESKVRMLLVYQDYNQLQSALGEHKAGSVVGAMEVQIYGPTRSVATAKLVQELSGTELVSRKQPRVMPSFIDTLFGNTKTEPAKMIEREEPRIKAQQLYSLKKGRFFAFCAASGRYGGWERVNARWALWPYFAWLVLPLREQPVNLVRPTYPDSVWQPGEPRRAQSEPQPVDEESMEAEPTETPDQGVDSSGGDSGSAAGEEADYRGGEPVDDTPVEDAPPSAPRRRRRRRRTQECRTCGYLELAGAEACSDCGAKL